MILLAGPAEAKCHIYSVWHYPKPQKCFTAYAPLPHRNRLVMPPERIEIPIPNLEWIACPDGDERLRGIAILRDLMDAR